ncbi:MAG: hypothetical protein AB1439_01485 [candidate division FCPU426 bacterium]
MLKRVFAMVVLLAWFIPAWAQAEVKYVQVNQTRLLERATAFSKAKAVLPYRTAVDVLGQQGAYYLVKAGKAKGYVAQRSLTVKKPAYSTSGSGSREYVSSDEVAMATKGFNQQVEAEYRRGNPDLAYAELDRLEKATACPDPGKTYKAFRKAGCLGEFQKGGGAQ